MNAQQHWQIATYNLKVPIIYIMVMHQHRQPQQEQWRRRLIASTYGCKQCTILNNIINFCTYCLKKKMQSTHSLDKKIVGENIAINICLFTAGWQQTYIVLILTLELQMYLYHLKLKSSIVNCQHMAHNNATHTSCPCLNTTYKIK